ncbi:hypothetical protein RJ641_021497 [Dillenia turbinata]|uniref:Uncharacterized protein n=1 Tax=Dillenia turbinata TaxID=194707 RepID=A0AAN8YV37_9MAGN
MRLIGKARYKILLQPNPTLDLISGKYTKKPNPCLSSPVGSGGPKDRYIISEGPERLLGKELQLELWEWSGRTKPSAMAKDNNLQMLTALDAAKTQLFHFTAIIIAGMGFFTDAYDLFRISRHIAPRPLILP